MLVVANLSGEPIEDYALSLTAGSLAPVASAAERLHGAAATAPALTPLGRFAGYKPLARLEPRRAYYVELRP